MTRRIASLCASWILAMAPVATVAQPAQQAATTAPQSPASRLWLVVGGSSTTMRGDCQECEENYPYRHTGGVMGDVGIRVNPRMDVGLELFWMPVDTESGNIRATHFDGVAQFRPWSSQGFFVKGGAGIAFIRNWVDVIGPDAYNQKALSVVVGAGWAFRPNKRVGFQVFGSQHAAAMGDLQTSGDPIADVMGNFWSIGGGLVIR